MIRRFKEYLDNKDIEYTDKSEDIISFKTKNLNFVFIYDKDSPYYCRVLLPRVYRISDTERLEIFELLNQLSRKIRLLKWFVSSSEDGTSDVWLTVEQFCFDSKSEYKLFDVSIDILNLAYRELEKKLNVLSTSTE